MAGHDDVDRLLAEQRAYYSEIAPDYEHCALSAWNGADLVQALGAFAPSGDVLELACGTGMWTELVAPVARSLTSVDASPEMLERARARLQDAGGNVSFVQSDIFEWEPDRLYDTVVFCFWLSHVPLERFVEFWALVGRALKPGGRVFFADDGFRTPDEAIPGGSPSVVRRRLADGSTRTIFKVEHDLRELEGRLAEIGWRIAVTPAQGPFYWGQGSRQVPADGAI